MLRMTEGKGYCARRQERLDLKKLAQFINEKDRIIVVPDVSDVSDKR